MNCIKCGREIILGQVFCKDCLERTDRYPVKPDTPVLLPNRIENTPPRRVAHTRKNRKPEERMARMRRLLLIQTLALIAVLVAFIITVLSLVQQMDEVEVPVLPGQNYSTQETVQNS